MIGLEGPRCDDLDPVFVEAHFNVNSWTQRDLAAVALAVCAECPVKEQCREQAMNAGPQPGPGVIGGVTGWSIRRARAWRLYELGYSDTPPKVGRPDWLTRSSPATEGAARAQAGTQEPA